MLEDVHHAAFERDPLAKVRARLQSREVRPARLGERCDADDTRVRLEHMGGKGPRPSAACDFDQLPGGRLRRDVGLDDKHTGASILNVDPLLVEERIGDHAFEFHRMRRAPSAFDTEIEDLLDVGEEGE